MLALTLPRKHGGHAGTSGRVFLVALPACAAAGAQTSLLLRLAPLHQVLLLACRPSCHPDSCIQTPVLTQVF